MKTIAQDQKRTESLLQRRGIRLHDIQSFSFMKRFHEVPRKSNLKVKDKYGDRKSTRLNSSHSV